MSDFDIKDVYRPAATKYFLYKDTGKPIKSIKYTVEVAATIMIVFAIVLIIGLS